MDTDKISISLKWSKKVFSFQIQAGDSGRTLKEKIQKVTNVKVERQKILVQKKNKNGSGSWKGSLQNDYIFSSSITATDEVLSLTLIGSAESIAEPPPTPTKFVEDMTQEEMRQIEEATINAALEHAVGMIPAIQNPPHLRDDGKQEVYQYNRLVSGLPQRQIEDLLKQQQQQKDKTTNKTLVGKVAMTMGLELRRAYINDLAVLKDDGTLISALDDGHVQLWRHGELQHDVIHGGHDGGVDSVLSITHESCTGVLGNNDIAFCTAGRGSFKLWTKTGRDITTIPTPVPGTSPLSLVQVMIPAETEDGRSIQKKITCLVGRFKITQQPNTSQFRLVPQDEEGRQRRAIAEAQEAARQELLGRMANSVQVIVGIDKSQDLTSQQPVLQSFLLQPEDGNAAPITSLAAVTTKNSNTTGSSLLVCGDTTGGMRIWNPQIKKIDGENETVQFVQQSYIRLVPQDSETFCSIVCMEPLADGRHLAVSTERTSAVSTNIGSIQVTSHSVPFSRAVYIIAMQMGENSLDSVVMRVLNGHTKDAVHCMCALPNGTLMTGGGKLDASLQLWKNSQILPFDNDQDDDQTSRDTTASFIQTESAQDLSSVCGYVFALEFLPDLKEGSSEFAIAAGRYNTVKILL